MYRVRYTDRQIERDRETDWQTHTHTHTHTCLPYTNVCMCEELDTFITLDRVIKPGFILSYNVLHVTNWWTDKTEIADNI